MNHNAFISNEENDALEKIVNLKPDIIILDLIIGGMEVLKQVRGFDKNVGIIMISGFTNESICTEALDAGADMYITKPVDFHHLTTNILPHLIKTKEQI
jgi:DNA-binding response OmpR family regulator